MTERKSRVRALAASVMGAAAFCGVLSAVASLTGAAWLSPARVYGPWFGGDQVASWIATGLIAVAGGLLHTAWFDRLLSGTGPVRGLKYGLLAWTWSLLALSVAQGYGLAWINTPSPALAAATMLGAWASAGVVVGTVYGGLRAHDEYLWGMGYGLPDRRSIV